MKEKLLGQLQKIPVDFPPVFVSNLHQFNFWFQISWDASVHQIGSKIR